MPCVFADDPGRENGVPAEPRDVSDSLSPILS